MPERSFRCIAARLAACRCRGAGPLRRRQGRARRDVFRVRHPMSIVTDHRAQGSGGRRCRRRSKQHYGMRLPGAGRSAEGTRLPPLVRRRAMVCGRRRPRRRRALSRAQGEARGTRLLLGPEPRAGDHARLPAPRRALCSPRARRSISIPRVFGPGRCGGDADGACRRSPGTGRRDAFELSVFRGFSENFWEWLTEQAEEFGYMVK